MGRDGGRRVTRKQKPTASLVRSSAAEYLTFVAASGTGGVEAVYAAENVWLSQRMMAQLYDVEVPTINYHLKKVFEDSELEEDAVIRNFRITAAGLGHGASQDPHDHADWETPSEPVPRRGRSRDLAQLLTRYFNTHLLRKLEKGEMRRRSRAGGTSRGLRAAAELASARTLRRAGPSMRLGVALCRQHHRSSWGFVEPERLRSQTPVSWQPCAAHRPRAA